MRFGIADERQRTRSQEIKILYTSFYNWCTADSRNDMDRSTTMVWSGPGLTTI